MKIGMKIGMKNRYETRYENRYEIGMNAIKCDTFVKIAV